MKEFPPYRLDADNRCLWKFSDKGQVEVHLSPKGFAVLAYLVDHADRLVTIDELLRVGWPEITVEPQAVKKQIHYLRGVLGDKATESRFIATKPKFGYRFIAPVSTQTIATDPTSPVTTQDNQRSSETHLISDVASAIQYATHVFHEEYLVSKSRPVPFGGRENEL